MSEWWMKYLGKPWAAAPKPPESYNCGELLRAVYLDLFGLPTAPIVADARDIRQCVEAMVWQPYGLRPLAAGEKPREFDSVFLARTRYFDHCGIAVRTVEGLMTLHALHEAGVVLESMGDLKGRGFKRLMWCRRQEIEHG